jgi:hypothetical protein
VSSLHLIPDSRLRDEDVRNLCYSLQHDDNCMTDYNRLLKSVYGQNQVDSPTVIFRGVGVGSPNHAAALTGIALTDLRWVQRDYPKLGLPAVSYWSDPSLERSEMFWALNHAFGGDFPQRWEEAQKGVILAHPFLLGRFAKQQIGDALQTPNMAWKYFAEECDDAKERDEYLVFTRIAGCQHFSSWSFVRAAVPTDIEAEVLLCAAYLDFLEEHVKGNWTNPPDAEALLRCYL